MALHRARQADAERVHRNLQWPPTGRAPERDAVLDAASDSDRPRPMAVRLQRVTPTFEAELADARYVCVNFPTAPRSGAALRQWLRARSRRSTRQPHPPQPTERTHNWIEIRGNVRGSGTPRAKTSGCLHNLGNPTPRIFLFYDTKSRSPPCLKEMFRIWRLASSRAAGESSWCFP